jgi:hypothetical protein
MNPGQTILLIIVVGFFASLGLGWLIGRYVLPIAKSSDNLIRFTIRGSVIAIISVLALQIVQGVDFVPLWVILPLAGLFVACVGAANPYSVRRRNALRI